MGTYGRFAGRVRARLPAPSCSTAKARRYLDFLSGLAVTSLGHAHPAVAAAVAEQASKLLHVSNLFHTEHQAPVAATLDALLGGGGRVLLRQLGRRGQRVRDQARAPLRPGARRARSATTWSPRTARSTAARSPRSPRPANRRSRRRSRRCRRASARSRSPISTRSKRAMDDRVVRGAARSGAG